MLIEASRDADYVGTWVTLATVLATSLFTTVHHYYRMGLFTILLGAALLTPAVTVSVARLAQPLAGAGSRSAGQQASR